MLFGASLPPSNWGDRNIIQSRWVLKIKRGPDNEISKYKARIVAKGFTQQFGTDYEETFAPVAKLSSVRAFFAYGASRKLIIDQMDVVSAYLHGSLDEDLYMAQPEGFVDPHHPDFVCKLQKGLYGLKQAGRQWYKTIDSFLIYIGFQSPAVDNCVYVKPARHHIILILYVDDIIIITYTQDEANWIKSKLSRKFQMKDLGQIHHFLGVLVNYDRSEGILTLSQAHYARKLIEKFGMSDCNSSQTPMETSQRLLPSSDYVNEDLRSRYRQLVGGLVYLMIATRPDISFAVSECSRFLHNPHLDHWNAAKRILRYLNGTPKFGLHYQSSTLPLHGYADADWAGDKEEFKSTSGYAVLLSSAAISWKSQLQKHIAQSSSEAEYIAYYHCFKDLIWLKHLLDIVLNIGSDSLFIHEDNQGCIKIIQNPIQHQRTKHFMVNYHYSRLLYKNKTILPIYCPTEDMVADIFTKALPGPAFKRHRSSLGVIELNHSSQRSPQN